MLAFLTDFTRLREMNCYNVAGFKNVQVMQPFSKGPDSTNEMGFLYASNLPDALWKIMPEFQANVFKDLVPDSFCCWDGLIKTRNAHLTVKKIVYNEHTDMDLLIS